MKSRTIIGLCRLGLTTNSIKQQYNSIKRLQLAANRNSPWAYTCIQKGLLSEEVFATEQFEGGGGGEGAIFGRA